MAQPASVQANGVPGPERAEPSQSTVPVKRKREVGDDANGDDTKTGLNGETASTDQKKTIRDYFEILSSFDTKSSILQRPVPQPASSEEPDAKRQKSDDPTFSIADKVTQDGYALLDDLAVDVLAAAKDRLSELRAKKDDKANDDSIAKTAIFKEKALELFRREMSYPHGAFDPSLKLPVDSTSDVPSSTSNLVLSVYGNAPTGRQLFSSLQKRDPASAVKPLPDILPPGISTTRIVPSRTQERTHTIGELFAPPRSLPPLQPPKQPKTQTKGNNLGFYHPELTDKSKYRTNSYFGQKLSVGHYLDYSNATPSSQIKTKQRERAQSLAGKKPSSTELEMSEFESLFRGAFSSFAPCKDDSAAVVPSGLAGRIHWQRFGHRSFNRMIDAEVQLEGELEAAAEKPAEQQEMELDEEFIEDAIKNWDDSLVDPSLEDVMGATKEDKETAEILDEVTDMIETLASYQRIRNLSLPSSTSRYSGDPVNGDMLANGAVPPPSEEETLTYETLKAQLTLIIKTLPPHAVAKLNGDKLDELLVSTKIEVRTDQYKGVMEDDAAAAQAKARQQQTAAAASTSRTVHRTSSASSVPYANQYHGATQYGTPTRTPIPAPQYYNQTRTPSQPSPLPRPGHMSHQPPRPQATPGYRPNGFPPYATQLAKTQTPYGHQNVQQYPGQARPQQYYGAVSQHSTPTARYPSAFPGYPPGTPTHGSYAAYTNGTTAQRTMSPQVPVAQYSPSQPQPQRQYGTPNQTMAGTPINRQQYANHASPTTQTPGVTGFLTVMPESQQTRMMEQAKARFAAQQSSMAFGDKISQTSVSGLAGIGLGGSFDAARIAAARASMPGGVGIPPKPQSPGLNPVRPMNGAPAIPHKVTPVPVPVIPPVQQQPQQQQQQQPPPQRQPQPQPQQQAQ